MRPYERVAEKLREAVRAASPGDALGSEVSIAKDCGVSRMTARKAVNALIAEGLVERRAGVGVFARGAESITRRFRLIAGDLLWDAAIRVASAARRVTLESGAEIELRDAHGDESDYLAEIAALPHSGATGAIVLSIHSATAEAALRELAASGFPLVVVDQAFAAGDLVGIASNNAEGGALAAEAIVAAGHERVGFLGDFEASTVRDRWEGFRAKLAELGCKAPGKYDIRGVARLESWEEKIAALVPRILKLKARPTALFCSCDAVARLAMRALEANGVKVPAEMSLVGFDDDPIAEWTTPALTTVRQSFTSIGRVAAEKLLALAAHADTPRESVIVPVALIRRDSLVRQN